MGMLKQALVMVVAGSLTACPLVIDEELSTDETASHAWGGYHWARSANPFPLTIADNVSSAWDAYFATSLADWSASSVLDLAGVPGTARKTCKATAGRVEVCAAKYGRNRWLGLASIWAVGDHITQGTVKLNDTYFTTASYNTPAWRNLVMCQEVGHTFGLDHQDEDFGNTPLGTCMDYSDDPDPNQHPNAHDYEQLELIYDHLDATATIGVSTVPDEVGDTPAGWGERVWAGSEGRNATYVRDFGAGRHVITFVTWAEPQ